MGRLGSKMYKLFHDRPNGRLETRGKAKNEIVATACCKAMDSLSLLGMPHM